MHRNALTANNVMRQNGSVHHRAGKA